MLRTNLSTRPFYNDRAVRLGLALAVVLGAALTAFNVLQVMSLNARTGEMSARIQAAEEETTRYRQQARTVTAAVDREEIALVQDAAREANQLIDRRAFSWTELFNRFELTLPPDVRIAAVEPQLDREGRMLVRVSVYARRVEDLNAFMDALELSGGFREVISRQDELQDDGTLRSLLEGYYRPDLTPPAIPATQEPPDGSAPAEAQPEAPRGDGR